MPAPWVIPVPADFVLSRDVCSYGYFLLEPNHWDPHTRTLSRTLELPAGPAKLSITQPTPPSASGRPRSPRGRPLAVVADRPVTARERPVAAALLGRMLRLDEDAAHVRAFHALDPRWKARGQGRLFRSPSFFEDVIKTVTSCNVAWPSTVSMNRRLCALLGPASPSGGRAFPSAAALAQTRPQTLRARCGVGYRDQRIVQLARLFVEGAIDPAFFENPDLPDDLLRERLLELPGIGPYAANNILQLLGRYAHIPFDTESLRHARTVLGMKGADRALLKRLARHYAPFGPHKFRAYWFELWSFYEAKRGPADRWVKEVVGSSFTAAQF
jgi:3-methyladenine DNA glycosylase/8-oxoguanine DNA glycosylase